MLTAANYRIYGYSLPDRWMSSVGPLLFQQNLTIILHTRAGWLFCSEIAAIVTVALSMSSYFRHLGHIDVSSLHFI